jgi:hypothetical protein
MGRGILTMPSSNKKIEREREKGSEKGKKEGGADEQIIWLHLWCGNKVSVRKGDEDMAANSLQIKHGSMCVYSTNPPSNLTFRLRKPDRYLQIRNDKDIINCPPAYVVQHNCCGCSKRLSPIIFGLAHIVCLV